MNVKLGDLAIVISSKVGNEGLIVEVLSYAGIPDDYVNDGPRWYCESKGRPINQMFAPKSRIAPLADRRLRPLPAIPENIDTHIDLPINEPA